LAAPGGEIISYARTRAEEHGLEGLARTAAGLRLGRSARGLATAAPICALAALDRLRRLAEAQQLVSQECRALLAIQIERVVPALVMHQPEEQPGKLGNRGEVWELALKLPFGLDEPDQDRVHALHAGRHCRLVEQEDRLALNGHAGLNRGIRRRRGAGRLRRRGARTHRIGLALQSGLVVERLAQCLPGSTNPALLLLDDMRHFVRQMPLLARAEMDLIALRISQRREARGLGRIAMYRHVV